MPVPATPLSLGRRPAHEGRGHARTAQRPRASPLHSLILFFVLFVFALQLRRPPASSLLSLRCCCPSVMAFLDFLKEVGPKRNATHMGVSFLFVFMAFSVSQNFQTSSDHKKQGANALGILYGCFTFFNFACSFVVQKLGPKVCLFGGACTYALFVAANIHYVRDAARTQMCNSSCTTPGRYERWCSVSSFAVRLV
jgi:hypothetical protein